ncbi:hypothetical protein VTK26DRAFT_5436 [Humicola hyalothermophila]
MLGIMPPQDLTKRLPNETLFYIADYLDEPDHFALSLRGQPIDEDWEYYHARRNPFTAAGDCGPAEFGVKDSFPDLNTKQHWGWAPLHVAIFLGDNLAVQLLLEYGADVNSQCSGLCDCLVRDLNGEDDPNESVSPTRFRTVWNALHVAMCRGNEQVARLLITHGASTTVGTRTAHAAVGSKTRLGITALQNAAWLGSMQMCQLLLATPRFRKTIDRQNSRKQTALHYAAAGGSIKTVGKLLLENGATFPDCDESDAGKGYLVNDPIRMLCMQFRILLSGDTNSFRVIQNLLASGASVDDCGGQSVLLALHDIRKIADPFDTKVQKNWLRLVDMFLSHGAATKTSHNNWQKVVEEACFPGNWSGRISDVKSDDAEMLSWVLDRCVDSRGRLLVPRESVFVLKGRADERSMVKTAEKLWAFAWRGNRG